MTTQNINGVVVTLTTAEETARASEATALEAAAATAATARAKAQTDAKSGNDKLVALGLTQDEVTALTGYNP